MRGEAKLDCRYKCNKRLEEILLICLATIIKSLANPPVGPDPVLEGSLVQRGPEGSTESKTGCHILINRSTLL